MKGRRISIKQGDDCSEGNFSFVDAVIYLEPGGKEIVVELGDGFVAKFSSPPKRTKKYTFTEAYQMMKAGKKMKAEVIDYACDRFATFTAMYSNGRLKWLGGKMCGSTDVVVCDEVLNAQWEEVP